MSAAEAGGGKAGWLAVWSDGAARGNPGPAGAGGVAKDEDGQVLVEVAEYLGETTNNVAEYHALILVLERAAGLGFRKVRLHTDSELVANQVMGGFKVKSAALKPLVGRVKALLEPYRELQVERVPREKNTECDRLANLAIDEGLAGLKRPLLSGDETLF